MSAYMFSDPAPSIRTLLGDAIAAGGSLTFYDLGTTDPRDTWSDADLSILNTNPVTLDGAGRPNTQIFMEGNYTVECKNSLGAVIWTRDMVPEVPASAGLPVLDAGEFITGDGGGGYVATTIRQMPDATGSTGQIPVTNGGGANGYTLQDLPDFTPPDPEIEVTADTFRAGVSTDDTKFYVFADMDSAPSSGTKFTSKAVTLVTGFDSLWAVTVMVRNTSATPAGALPTWSVSGFTPFTAASGFTVNFNIPDDDSTVNWKFNTAVDFVFVAIGTREIAPP